MTVPYLYDDKMCAKVIIFASGEVISVGAKNATGAKHHLEYMAQRLKEHYFDN